MTEEGRARAWSEESGTVEARERWRYAEAVAALAGDALKTHEELIEAAGMAAARMYRDALARLAEDW